MFKDKKYYCYDIVDIGIELWFVVDVLSLLMYVGNVIYDIGSLFVILYIDYIYVVLYLWLMCD